MENKTFLATDYLNRQDLEKDIKAVVGFSAKNNENDGHLVTGKREDLKKLNLDDTKTIHGVRVEITDSPTTEILKDKIKK